MKKGVLKNLTKVTGKLLCQSLFFNKAEGLRSATLLRKRVWHRCFPVNFVEISKSTFFTEHVWILLLCRLSKVEFYVSMKQSLIQAILMHDF